LADESVDNIPCKVVTSTLHQSGKLMTTTLWLGQQDHLIHKSQEVMNGVPAIPAMDDTAVKQVLQLQNKPATPEAIAAMREQLKSAQDAAKTLADGGITFVQIHHNIQVNPTLAPADFRPEK
jgi:hypothetical protein